VNRPASDRARVAAALLLALGLPLVGACRGEPEPDAYGNFETNEVTVSAEAGGQLLHFAPDDGVRLAAGAVVGQIDTAALALERDELVARRAVARSRAGDVAAQERVLRAQRETAWRELARTRRLHQDQAATRQQLDQAEGQVRVLDAQLAAARAQTGTAGRELPQVDARLALVAERLRDSRVVNPVAGTVLATYVHAGEVVRPGQALYRVANLDTLTLRAYVSGADLARVRLGRAVRVAVDVGPDRRRALPGVVTAVASDAEFTPTPIQTRDERTGLVYAVQVRVANPGGLLKVGMPGDVVFGPDGGTTTEGPRSVAARP
jgi:HlyD family secretion protein